MNKKRIFLSAALLTLALNALVLMLRGPEGSSASIALSCTAWTHTTGVRRPPPFIMNRKK